MNRSHAAWALIACTALLAWCRTADASQPACTGGNDSHCHDQRIDFDIPEQSLVNALRTYSETSGLSVLVDDALLAGRRTQGVRGSFTAAVALRQLLAGTGLAVRYTSAHAFTLTSDTAMPPSTSPVVEDEAAAPDTNASLANAFAGRVQAAVEQALCQSTETRPGGYRLAFQLWLDDSGRVARLHLLGSTGKASRDREIQQRLQGIELAERTPPAQQPLTLLLRPGESFDCRAPYAP